MDDDEKVKLYSMNRRMARNNLAVRRSHGTNTAAWQRACYYKQQHDRRALQRYDALLAAGLRRVISF